eukprot:CAMPEP_0115562682 /NCGR_PEP_ID=MMETSP0271-20121206/101645_2 /TAXON_ID=71861 /ORGANISM="Scrippsiella trochoidea, Strain CCMP3099" /LENGTH=91 /DNA_ID=CAMNT_0002996867 /DNA_START=1103 /DNA_END=1378 /DNA_ORIENTATION=-
MIRCQEVVLTAGMALMQKLGQDLHLRRQLGALCHQLTDLAAKLRVLKISCCESTYGFLVLSSAPLIGRGLLICRCIPEAESPMLLRCMADG